MRRLNFYAGPGSGKSTISAWLFAKMKQNRHSVELVQEYVKTWAYEGKVPTSYDQIYLFAKQLRKEDLVLRSGVKHIISDSPLFLSLCYAKKNSPEFFEPLYKIVDEVEKKYPSLNIFIARKDRQYSQEGRYQNYQEACDMDSYILEQLKNKSIEYHIFYYDDLEGIYSFVNTCI